MTYIAGEISREIYYSRRAELEGLRRNLAGSTPSGPAGPKRLDLDLELGGGAASGPLPPVLRRKPTEGSLELPLPGEDDDF